MGTRGPAPKRSDRRRRVNQPDVPVVKPPAAAEARAPAAKKDWHPIAKRWYWSLAKSGQAVFYEPGDWETAWVLAESMSREFKPQVVGATVDGEPVVMEVPPRAAALVAWRQTMAVLLVTEGDRRRVGVELQRADPVEDDDAVSELDEYRRRLSG